MEVGVTGGTPVLDRADKTNHSSSTRGQCCSQQVRPGTTPHLPGVSWRLVSHGKALNRSKPAAVKQCPAVRQQQLSWLDLRSSGAALRIVSCLAS